MLKQLTQKITTSLSCALLAIERPFGFFKRRWNCLLKRLDHKIENNADTILASFVLHNLTQITFIDDDNIVNEVVREERAARQRGKICNQLALKEKG